MERFIALLTAGTLALFGVIIVAGGLSVGGSYLGRSAVVIGTVAQLTDGNRPVVVYTVDGTEYQNATTEHGPRFAVGKSVEMCYRPTHPENAQTCSARRVGSIMDGVGIWLLGVAVVITIGAMMRQRRLRWVIQNGQQVSAHITAVRGNAMVHMVNKIAWYVYCVWTDPMGTPHTFTSPIIWSSVDPSPAMQAAGLADLPVYVDPSNPGKLYVVDDNRVRALLTHSS